MHTIKPRIIKRNILQYQFALSVLPAKHIIILGLKSGKRLKTQGHTTGFNTCEAFTAFYQESQLCERNCEPSSSSSSSSEGYARKVQ